MARRELLAAILAATVGALGLVAVAEPAVAGPQNVRGILTRDTDIAKMQAMHADTHIYVVWDQEDWDTLRLHFAEDAQAAGIKIWVWLRSPSNCERPDDGDEDQEEEQDWDCEYYLPYKRDYVRWASQIAQLSRQYPVVTAWSLDDFYNSLNPTILTPAYMSQVRQASRAIQPTLEFYPVVYHEYITASFVNSYAPVMDAAIMPYRDGVYRNTAWTGTLRNHLDTATATLAGRNRKLILMPYAQKLGSGADIAPDVDYVRRVTATGMDYMRRGVIEGVVHFGVNLDLGLPGSGDTNYSHGNGRGALALVLNPEETTSTGDQVSASTTIRRNPGSAVCGVRVRHTDNRGTTAPRGYHFMQVRVAGQLMWEQDVARDDGGEAGYHVTDWLDVSHLMGTGSNTLTLRLYEKQGASNYQVRVRFDDVETFGCTVTNPSFETTGGWSLTRNDGPLHGALHLHDPVYTTTVFNVIASQFAS